MLERAVRDEREDEPERKPDDVEPGRYRMVEAALGAPPTKEKKAQVRYRPRSSSQSHPRT
jgi:hypothetical protein